MKNLFEIHARKKLGMPEVWSVYSWECFPNTGEVLYYEVKGAIAPPRKRGRLKGRHNWIKRDKTTDKTCVITVAEHEQWIKEWEIDTGLCSNCVGEGKVFARWAKDQPVQYRQCRHCQGSGKLAKEEIL